MVYLVIEHIKMIENDGFANDIPGNAMFEERPRMHFWLPCLAYTISAKPQWYFHIIGSSWNTLFPYSGVVKY